MGAAMENRGPSGHGRPPGSDSEGILAYSSDSRGLVASATTSLRNTHDARRHLPTVDDGGRAQDELLTAPAESAHTRLRVSGPITFQSPIRFLWCRIGPLRRPWIPLVGLAPGA